MDAPIRCRPRIEVGTSFMYADIKPKLPPKKKNINNNNEGIVIVLCVSVCVIIIIIVCLLSTDSAL